jgi:hypothetical protein
LLFASLGGVGNHPSNPLQHQKNTRRVSWDGRLEGDGEGRRRNKKESYICFPPKINRCCTGGIPSFSSTFSLICDTFTFYQPHLFFSTLLFLPFLALFSLREPAKTLEREMAYPIIRLNIELDFLACEGSDSISYQFSSFPP